MEDYVKVVTRKSEEQISLKWIFSKIFMVEILKGMAFTIKTLFKKPVTRYYPLENLEAKPGFRGLHGLVKRPLTGKPRCVGCGLCAAICPSKCIKIFTEGPKKEKIVDRYEIDVTRCVYCGFCVEACPFQAILLTSHYDYAVFKREDLYITKEKLVDNYDKYMAGAKGRKYFKNFWGPKNNSFDTYKDQAVFNKKD